MSVRAARLRARERPLVEERVERLGVEEHLRVDGRRHHRSAACSGGRAAPAKAGHRGRSARETKNRGGGSAAAAAASSGLASKAGELGEVVGETKVPAVMQYGADAGDLRQPRVLARARAARHRRAAIRQ